MRIGIDANHLTVPYYTGSKNYSDNLIKSLAKIDKKNEYVIFTSKKVNIPRQKNFKLIVTPRLVPISKRQFLLSHYVKKEKVDIFHYLVPYGDPLLSHPRIVTTVHDVNLAYTYPFFGKHIMRRLICEITRLFIFAKTKSFITPSEIIKAELKDYLIKKNVKSPINSIHEGVSKDFKVINKKEIGKNYILCMGDFAERKNVSRVLEAYSKLSGKVKSETKIFIISSTPGPSKKFKSMAADLNILSRTKVFINPSQKQLIELYNKAVCFVWPSLYEGFGLPLVEAMSCGCPVVTSDYGAMKEVVGNAGILVNPRSSSEISKAMQKILLNHKLASSLRKKGLKRVKKFNWDIAAHETLKVYSKLYKTRID